MSDFAILTAVLLLLALDMTAVAARNAFLATNHARLLSLRERNEARVNLAASLLLRAPRLRASLNLLLILTRVFLTGLLLLVLVRQPWVEPFWTTLAGLLIFGILLFWVEWAFDSAANRSPETWALRTAPFVRVIMFLAGPPLLVPGGVWGEPEGQHEGTVTVKVTEDELKNLVGAGQEEGMFAKGEGRMIYSIIQLGETLAREIMVPRIDMLTLDIHTPLPEAADVFLRSGHSRVPVYEESIDNTLGLLYAKDLLRVWREGNQVESLRSLLRPAYFTPEAKKVDDLLAEMQSQRIHMAIVVDEYGGVAGLLTLEDIVEEIVGEIQDEYDQAEEAPYQVLKDNTYVFLGRVDVDDFNEVMGSSISRDEADTVGGLIYSRLGRVPDVGEQVLIDGLQLTVEQVSGRRIRKVRASRLPDQNRTEEETDERNR